VLRAAVRVAAALLLLCLLAPARAHADGDALNHVISQAVQKDVAADLPLAAVIDRPFTPFDGVLAGGYTRDTEWLRLVIRPRADSGPLVLRIQPAYLNELTLPQALPQRWPAGFIGARGERLHVIEPFDHRCCWAAHWPALHAAADDGAALQRVLASLRRGEAVVDHPPSPTGDD
jgi:hypothetical protein